SARIAVLGRIGVTDIYRDVREYPAAEELPGLKIVRFDAPLNFANAERLRDFVMQLVDDCARPADSDDQAGKSSRVHTILLDCSSWVYADMVGIRTVKEAYALLLSRNYRVLFAACKDSVRLLFFQEDFLKDADVSLFYLTVHDAVLFASRVAPNNQAETIWRIPHIDLIMWLVAALSVLILNLAIGLGFTLFSVILRTQSARIAVLGRIGDTDIYRDVREYPAAEELPGLKMVCFDAPLNFANAERFRTLCCSWSMTLIVSFLSHCEQRRAVCQSRGTDLQDRDGQ
uniref:STAS domain-containing protein n=1 Tax=Macrostomum lignano TaxID=282301 RepID=A0A1I8GPD4_9PLAT